MNRRLKLTEDFHIHPLFFLLAASAILTGAIYDFIILFSIVVIHELGHYRMAKRFGWRVERVEIWLFGGAVVSEEHNTRPFREQLYVILAGPFQHVWMFGLLILSDQIFGPHSLLTAAFYYNGLVLLFNLLPVWPLDGGKLLFYCLNRSMTFKNAQAYTLIFSIGVIGVASLWMTVEARWTLPGIWLTAFLLIENRIEWKRRTYTLLRYCLYRMKAGEEPVREKLIHVRPETKVRELLKNIHSRRSHFYVLKDGAGSYIVNEQTCLHAYFNEGDADLLVKDLIPTA
ncbi:stage IV sporulation protein FB [Halobacillus fulvus]|nr:stage IV sporulation protein FB [Halobacillus fulvus]